VRCHARIVSAGAAFEHRDFRLAMVARALSVTGGQMQTVAIGWHVYEITRRPLDLGLVGLAQFVPAAALSLVAGHAADRFDRRRILLLYHLGMVAAGAVLFGVARSGTASILPIYIVAMMLGVLRTFAGPANQSLLPHLVPAESFASAVGWSSSIWQVAAIVGPALGGLIYGLGSDHARAASLVYAAAGTLAFGAFLAMLAMQLRVGRLEKRAMSWATVLAGVRFVFREKIVLGSISLDLFAVLFGGAVALLPVYARDILHVGPSGLGFLRSAPALGAAVVAITLAYRPLTRKLGPILFASVAVFGFATIVFGLSRSFALSLLSLFVLGAADMISVVIRQLLVQLATPPSMRGRVSAVNLVFVGASNELGEFESGATAALLGVVPAVVVGGVATCLVVVLWSVFFPGLRTLDAVPKPAEDPAAPGT
jgi:MFS family permease